MNCRVTGSARSPLAPSPLPLIDGFRVGNRCGSDNLPRKFCATLIRERVVGILPTHPKGMGVHLGRLLGVLGELGIGSITSPLAPSSFAIPNERFYCGYSGSPLFHSC